MREKNIRIPHGEDPGIYLFGRRTLMIDGRAELTDYSEETVIFRPRTGKDLIRIAADNIKSLGFDIPAFFCAEKACEYLSDIIIAVIPFGNEASGCRDIYKLLQSAKADRDALIRIGKGKPHHTKLLYIYFQQCRKGIIPVRRGYYDLLRS